MSRSLCRGFTLIELLATLVVVAILATLAAPAFRDVFVNNNTAAIANDFTSSIMRARSAAASRNMCVVLCRSVTTSRPVTDTSGPVCANSVKKDWKDGWLIFGNPDCDPDLLTPAVGQIIGIVTPVRPNFSLTYSGTGRGQDYLMFTASGYPRRVDAGSYDLQYLNEVRDSNRKICLSAIGNVATVALDVGVCP